MVLMLKSDQGFANDTGVQNHTIAVESDDFAFGQVFIIRGSCILHIYILYLFTSAE